MWNAIPVFQGLYALEEEINAWMDYSVFSWSTSVMATDIVMTILTRIYSFVQVRTND